MDEQEHPTELPAYKAQILMVCGEQHATLSMVYKASMAAIATSIYMHKATLHRVMSRIAIKGFFDLLLIFLWSLTPTLTPNPTNLDMESEWV